MTARFRLTAADGTTYPRAAVRAQGGLAGPDDLRRAQVRLARGRTRLGLFQPAPGCISVLPGYCAAEDGPEVVVPLAGLTWEAVP